MNNTSTLTDPVTMFGIEQPTWFHDPDAAEHFDGTFEEWNKANYSLFVAAGRAEGVSMPQARWVEFTEPHLSIVGARRKLEDEKANEAHREAARARLANISSAPSGALFGSSGGPRAARLMRASEMPKPKPVEWLEPGLLARGELNYVFGEEGIGKSSWWRHVAAKVTRNGGQVFVVCPEEGWAQQTAPGLIAAGCDLDNVHTWAVDDGEHCDVAIPMPDDLDGEQFDLIVFDALNDLVGPTEWNKWREKLRPWIQVARHTNAALLGVGHTNRDRSGSTRAAFGTSVDIRKLARHVLLAQLDDAGNLAVGVEKTNVAERGLPASLYRMESIFVGAIGSHVGALQPIGIGTESAEDMFARRTREQDEKSHLGDANQEILEFARDRAGEFTPKDVAEALGIDNQLVGTRLGKLERGGYITKISRGRYTYSQPTTS